GLVRTGEHAHPARVILAGRRPVRPQVASGELSVCLPRFELVPLAQPVLGLHESHALTSIRTEAEPTLACSGLEDAAPSRPNNLVDVLRLAAAGHGNELLACHWRAVECGADALEQRVELWFRELQVLEPRVDVAQGVGAERTGVDRQVGRP